MKFKTLDEQWLLISRGVEEVLPEDDLKVKLKKSISSKTPLNVKLGCEFEFYYGKKDCSYQS